MQANDLIPVAVISADPDRTWFYNLEDVVFNADDSFVANGYINYTKWYVDGIYQTGGSYWRSMSICFALDESPPNGCYQLASGQTTVQIKLEVQSNHGYWDEQIITYTIREHKGRRYFVKDHLGSVRATVNRDGNVLVYDDYYPFGLAMPGRSSNSANPNDSYKFTGHELDDEAGLGIYHMNARGMDPVLGRMMQIDSRAEKYPGISPYAYVLNSPVNFTDMTGDTVDISQVQKVYDGSVYGSDHERAGERKDYADMTAQEQQAYWFMDYYNNGGAEELAAFDIGGEFETTNITFSFATESPGQTFLGFTLPFSNKGVGFGLTTFGLRNEPLHQHDTGGSASVVRTSLDNVDFNVYLSPVNVRNKEYTARHEMGHVRYITGRFLQGMGTPILSGPAQDGKVPGVRTPYIPTVPELIRMKNK